MSYDEKELFWAAGFLEGEGSFSGSDGHFKIRADQTYTREPLDRLMKLFGGSVFPLSNQKRRDAGSNTKDNMRWQVGSVGAIVAILSLYPLLSIRRRVQIDKAFGIIHGKTLFEVVSGVA